MNAPAKEHPRVAAHRQKLALETRSEPLDAEWLRQLCLDAGAEDVGFVEVDRPALADEHPHIHRAFARTRSLISFVLRMNRDNVRSPARSIANSEFHHTGDEVNDVARRITAALGFLAGERNLLWALFTRRIRLQGNPKWLLALKRCFPS